MEALKDIDIENIAESLLMKIELDEKRCGKHSYLRLFRLSD